MESAQEVSGPMGKMAGKGVSILVVMESAQEAYAIKWGNLQYVRFNPCCNGKCSGRGNCYTIVKALPSFNPCCNGKCSGSIRLGTRPPGGHRVSILVVMESAQEGRRPGRS